MVKQSNARELSNDRRWYDIADRRYQAFKEGKCQKYNLEEVFAEAYNAMNTK